MKNSYGGYTLLTVPSEVMAAAPKPVQQAWTQVTTAQKRYLQVRDELALMEVDAERAPAADEQAARAAVAAGKPIPAPTANAALDAVDAKRRELGALLDHVDGLELNFLAILTDHKPDLVAGFYGAAVSELAATDAALAAAAEAVSRFTLMAALWGWARDGDVRTPPGQGFQVPTALHQSVDVLIRECRTAMSREHPDAVTQRAAEYEAEVAALRGRATADGLITDYAAYAAYDR